MSTLKSIFIKYSNSYKDGGTKEYRDKNNNKYFLDYRINSKTRGELFDRYPDESGAIMLDLNEFSLSDNIL